MEIPLFWVLDIDFGMHIYIYPLSHLLLRKCQIRITA
jgi:hypothetical protein